MSKVTVPKGKEEEKAIKDAETVAANAPDEKTKTEAVSTLAAADKDKDKDKPLPNPKPPVKSYDIKSLKKDPLADVNADFAKDKKAQFDAMSEDEKKRFVIKNKLLENRYLDKKDMHEISLEDERLVSEA